MLVRRTENPVLTSMLNDFFGNNLFNLPESKFFDVKSSIPSANIKENKNEFIVELAVPGIDKSEISIDLKDNYLTVSSEKSDETDDENNDYSLKEYNYKSFKRVFTLPENVIESNNISAKYLNGELIITIPKKVEIANEPKKIDIN